jgi:hypothetical protein
MAIGICLENWGAHKKKLAKQETNLGWPIFVPLLSDPYKQKFKLKNLRTQHHRKTTFATNNHPSFLRKLNHSYVLQLLTLFEKFVIH